VVLESTKKSPTRNGRAFFIESDYTLAKNKIPDQDDLTGDYLSPLFSVVPEPGLEPGQDCSHKILSLARLPIPPSRHFL
jgi:hypothetical protein